MEAARPRGRRLRTRRGTVDRPLNARLVRVASLVVAPALLALLFSVSTTGILPRPLFEPLFDETAAAETATELSTVFPSRVPGSVEAESATRWYTETISALGLATEEDIWSVDLPDLGRVELRNVVTVVPGRSERAIVLVAHRDNAGARDPAGDNASGTAALIELARGFVPQEIAPAPLPYRTLVLLSTDGGAYGGAGAARFAEVSPLAELADVAIVLDGLGGRGRPHIAVAGDRASSPARVLVRTASARVEEQVGAPPKIPSVVTQLVDLGIPYAAGEQGPLLARGIAAVTLTTDEPTAPNVPAGDPGAPLAVARLGQLGRAAEALIGSVDASVGTFRTSDTVFLDDRTASGWTVRMTLIAAVVPFVLGVLDLLVRGRRDRLPFAPALRSLRARAILWLYAGLLLWIGALTGVLPAGASLPLPSYSSFVVDWPLAGLTVLAVGFVLGWLVARRRLLPLAQPTPEERLAGYTAALAWLGLVAIAVALVKPYALIFVLPSLYAWLWLPLHPGRWQRTALYLAGMVGPAGGLFVLSNELGLDLYDAPLYVAGLVTVGYVSVVSVLLAIAWAAAAAQLAALAFGRYAPYAGGVEPAPRGPIQTSLVRLGRSARRRGYSRAR